MSDAHLPFALVDVFATRPLAGNPLAVCLVPAVDTLDVDTVRRLAREFNQSETTVLSLPQRGVARLRSFTPTGAEVTGAGHNALGAWWWLAQRGDIPLEDGPNAFTQQLGGRHLPLWIDASQGAPQAVRMRQEPPRLGSPLTIHRALADALGVPIGTIESVQHPVRTASTGVDHLMVPIASGDLDELAPDSSQLRELLASVHAQGCYAYSVTPNAETDAQARFFNPTVGIHEDSATGSAAGPLAAHLADLGAVPPAGRVAIGQGHHVGRPSILEVVLDGEGDVLLTGTCVVAASGYLHGDLRSALEQ